MAVGARRQETTCIGTQPIGTQPRRQTPGTGSTVVLGDESRMKPAQEARGYSHEGPASRERILGNIGWTPDSGGAYIYAMNPR
jgi:hypothetical protein